MTTRDLNDFLAHVFQKLDTGRFARHDFDELAALLVACRDTGRAITQGKTGHPSLWDGLTDLASLACSIAIKPEQALASLTPYRVVPYGDPVTTGYRVEKNTGDGWSALPGMYPDVPAALAAIEAMDLNHGEIALPAGASITPATVAGEPVRCVPRMPAAPPSSVPIGTNFRVTEVMNADAADAPTGTGKFSVQMLTRDAWTNALNNPGFEPELWPWRKFDTINDAETAILAWGKRVNLAVTVIRSQTEIVTAAPGASFPRKVADRVQFFTYDADTNQPPATLIDKSTVYRIRPDMVTGEGGWLVWRWTSTGRTWTASFERPAFREFSLAIAVIEARHITDQIHIELPRPVDVERWRKAGFVVDLPGFGDYEAAERDSPVTMSTDFIDVPKASAFTAFHDPTVPAEMTAAITATASELLSKVATVTISPGTRLPVPLADGLWAIDEWNGEQWSRITGDLEWDEVEQHIRPQAAGAPVIEVGTCQIRDAVGFERFDVFQWSGFEWRQIAGDVSKGTAQGVVKARELERMGQRQEMPATMKAGVIKQWRQLMKSVKNDLVDIKIKLHRANDTMSVDEMRMLISSVKELTNQSLARFDGE